MHRTSAWPLALSCIGLIVYASLYPFGDWRDQGISPLSFLWSPLPKYWTGFDVAANLLGYFPLGFLLALTALRTGRGMQCVSRSTLVCLTLSLTMESLQSYLPTRVPSNLDLLLNVAGGGLGASLASALESLGTIDHWSRLRARWFVPDASGALVLLALWPIALLFPAAVPFGLGQVVERLEATLVDLLGDSPFLEWLPLREVELQPLVPAAELTCVVLGLLIPCLLGYCIVRSRPRRAVLSAALLLVGIAATSLSAALSYSPQHAWVWLQRPVLAGAVVAPLLALALVPLGRRNCAAVALLLMGVYLALLNQAPVDPYFAQTLQSWEQGRFIRFNGLAQWIGWLWPYATVIYLFAQMRDRQGKT